MLRSSGLYVFEPAANFGLIGVRGTILTYTAELFPTRVRGVGQRFTWALAGLLTRGVPYAALWIRNLTGSLSVAFLVIPVLLPLQLVGLWVGKEEHARGRICRRPASSRGDRTCGSSTCGP
jgi:hypothetical protein